MHTIEPYWKWRLKYQSEFDQRSPFYGREYSELCYSTVIYNHYIHPQWDYIESPTLYIKILFTDYSEGYSIIEFIGEWNDAINNDIMFLKREVIDILIQEGIHKFVLIGENVLNFHAEDDSYYAEWYDELDSGGWIVPLNFRKHVLEEMQQFQLFNYLETNPWFNDLAWRKLEADKLIDLIEELMLRKLSS